MSGSLGSSRVSVVSGWKRSEINQIRYDPGGFADVQPLPDFLPGADRGRNDLRGQMDTEVFHGQKRCGYQGASMVLADVSSPASLTNRNDFEIHPVDCQEKLRAFISARPRPQQEKEALGIEIRKDHQIRSDLRIDFIKPPGDFRRIDKMLRRPRLNWRDLDKKDGNVSP